MVNEHTALSTNRSATASRAVAWLVTAIAIVVTMLSAVGGCTETPIDGTSADTTLRTPRREDTTVVSERRASRDTVVESEHIVVIDTVIRLIVVRDTVQTYDTVVSRNRFAREQDRTAVISCFNAKTNKWDSVDAECRPDILELGPGMPPQRLKFEIRLPLARLLTEEQFGPHDLSQLYINIPDAPLRPGSLQLKGNPDTAMGTSLIWRDRLLRTGPEFGNRNAGDFQVQSVDVEHRMLEVLFRGFFQPGAPMYPIAIHVRFRMSY